MGIFAGSPRLQGRVKGTRDGAHISKYAKAFAGKCEGSCEDYSGKVY